MIKITFLGTSDAVPTAERNHTSLLLTYGGENVMIDCGEGTQRQIRKAGLNPCKITRLLISHWHGDHVLGIPGLLQTLSLSGYNKTLHVYGPEGTKKSMKEILKIFGFTGECKMKVEEVSGKFLDEKDFSLEAKPMTHNVPCNAYSFTKKGRLRIDKTALKKTGLPNGPLLKDLKQGKNVSFGGKKYSAKNLTFMDEDKKISFILDTTFNSRILSFVRNSDLMISESSFADDLKEKAREYGHMTATQVAKTAGKGDVGKLALIHVSQRYDGKRKEILSEAKKFHKNTVIAEDLDVIEI